MQAHETATSPASMPPGATIPARESGQDLMVHILQRSARLYTLPAVAVEVLRLTSDPTTEVAALKACIERDPALTAKILRIVNSSLYGLSTHVGNLSQAVALLGIKPLKLLVLGFSLPDALLASLAGEQLERYWATALARAVAAKEIAERFYARDGDDAFVAGLLNDIGMLVLLAELGEPYARFLQTVWQEEGDPRVLEQGSLGFDHSQLTAALLAQWKMPTSLVQAVRLERSDKRLKEQADAGELSQVLYLANLTAGLVGRHRLNVLPELLEAGTDLCGLDKPALHDLVEELEPKVAALADALEVPLSEGMSYLQILADAQARMAEIGEEVAAPLARLERAEALLAQAKAVGSSHLREARGLNAPEGEAVEPPVPSQSDSDPARSRNRDRSHELVQHLKRCTEECRAAHRELSLLLIDAGWPDRGASQPVSACGSPLKELIVHISGEIPWVDVHAFPLSPSRCAAILCGCTRRDAIDISRRVLSCLKAGGPGPGGAASRAGAGIATAEMLPRNFDASRLLEAAQRCLSAAQSSGGPVKSIELY